MNHSSGYTLVETLVALAIFGILLTVTVSVLRGGTIKDKIQTDTAKLVAVVRQARNRAFNGIVASATGLYPAGGWGVFLDTTSNPVGYILFADNDGDRIYDSGEEEGQFAMNVGVAMTLRTGSGSNPAKGTVVFKGNQFPQLLNVECDPDESSFCNPPWTQHNSNIIVRLFGSGTSCTGRLKFAAQSQGSLLIEESYLSC